MTDFAFRKSPRNDMAWLHPDSEKHVFKSDTHHGVVYVRPENEKLHVDYMTADRKDRKLVRWDEGQIDPKAANSVGIKGVKQVRDYLKERYPQATEVVARRTSGARLTEDHPMGVNVNVKLRND